MRPSCGGAVDPNYTITYVGGSVAITTANLTVTASSGSMAYGGAVPTISAGYTGFVNRDTASSLSVQPTCSTTATRSSPGGIAVPDVVQRCRRPELRHLLRHGVVIVGSATLTVTASSGPMTYGGTVPTITPSYSGFVNSDTASSLTMPPTCSTTATSASSVRGRPM